MSELSWAAGIADMGLKSSAWLGLAVLLLWMMRGETARARHRACLIALCGLPFLPLLHCLPPVWKIPVGSVPVALAFPVYAERPVDPVRPTNLLSAEQSMPLTVGQKAADYTDYKASRSQGTGGIRDRGFASFAPLSDAPLSNVSTSQIPMRHSQPLSGVSVLVSVWIAGVVLVMLRNLNSWRALNRLQRDSAPVPAGCFADALTNAAREHGGSKRRIRLRVGGQTPGFAAPMTWGWLRPVVWLPDGAEGWTPECLRVVLLHETAHIQRSDWFWQTITACLCAVYWFHPLVWLLNRHLHIESERACDDCVLQTGVPAACYAQHLLDVARTLKSLRNAPLVAVTMARSSQIEARLRAILASQDSSRLPLSQMRARLAALALPVTLLPLSATQLTTIETRLSAPTMPLTIQAQEPQAPSVRAARQTTAFLPPALSQSAQVVSLSAGSGATDAAVSGEIPIKSAPIKPAPAMKPSEAHLFASLLDSLTADTLPVSGQPTPAAARENIILEPTRDNGDRSAKNAVEEGAGKPLDTNRASKRAGTQNEPVVGPDKKQENKAREENAGVQEPPAEIEPDAERLLAQTAEVYGALHSLSLTIHYENSPPFFGLTHANWNVLWKNPNRAIITCKNATGTSRFLAEGSNLYVFATRDTQRYARLPLKPSGKDLWRQISGHAFEAGVSGMQHLPALLEGITPTRMLGSSLRSLKMGTRDMVEGVAVQNVLAQTEYNIYPPFMTRRQTPTSTQRALLTYAIGLEDHLVHRITHKALSPPSKDGTRLSEYTQTFADIKTNPDVPDSAFAFTPPADREAEEKVADLGERNHDHHLKPGVPAPDFTAKDINGKTVSLSQYRGKTVLLVFWTRDCGSTNLETDALAAQYRKYQAQGFEVVGICDDFITPRATLPAFLKKHSMTWPQILDGGRATGPVFRRYGVKGTMQAMLIDQKGNILNPDASVGSVLNYQLEQLFSPSHS